MKNKIKIVRSEYNSVGPKKCNVKLPSKAFLSPQNQIVPPKGG